jgi:hypothetical protein
MVKKNGETLRPMCFLSHSLLNKLSAIVGNCEIVRERASKSGHSDSECLRRIDAIHQIALAMAEELDEHVCELDAVLSKNWMRCPQCKKVQTMRWEWMGPDLLDLRALL